MFEVWILIFEDVLMETEYCLCLSIRDDTKHEIYTVHRAESHRAVIPLALCYSQLGGKIVTLEKKITT